MSVLEETTERAFERERRRNARTFATVRLFAAVAWAAAALVLGWRPQQPAIVGYLVLAGAVWLSVRRWPALLEASFWAILVLDLPMLTFVQVLAMQHRADDPAYSAAMNVALLGLVVAGSTFALRARVIWAVAVGALVAQLIALYLCGQYSPGRLVGTVLSFGTLAGLGSALVRQVRRLVHSTASEQAARARLQRYFSPAVATDIVNGNADVRGQHRVITVLVADIRGFTTMTAGADAETVVAWLDEWLAAMVVVIFRNGGTLDKFLGDGLLAWFGAPHEQTDQAERAVRCALQMQAAMTEVNRRRESVGRPPLQIGIGVHTALALVGDIGPEMRREYTAIGDAVTIASRIEGLTKVLGVGVLVSGATRIAAGEGFAWQAMPDQVIRGRAAAIEVWGVE